MHPYDIHIKIEYEYEYPYLLFKRIRIRIIRMFRHIRIQTSGSSLGGSRPAGRACDGIQGKDSDARSTFPGLAHLGGPPPPPCLVAAAS